MLLAINGSEFVNNPWNLTFQAYTNLLGPGAFLIVLCFIAAALYMKTHNAIAVSCFIWVSGLLLVGGGLFTNYPEMAFVFLIFTAVGFVGTFLGVYFNRKFVV